MNEPESNAGTPEKASSLHEVDGRAVRSEGMKEERWWEVEILTTAKTWTRILCARNEADIKSCYDNAVFHLGKKSVRVVAVEAVTRTETVVKRMDSSPIGEL